MWCYEVASLNWVTRQVATALFGAPPQSSYEEALAYLQRSEELAQEVLARAGGKRVGAGGGGPMMTTRLMAGKACAAMGRKEEARAWLALSTQVAPGPGEDEDAVEQQRALAKALGVAL